MVRTRFAPSPTGELHVGSARTALFNWLFAKNQTGNMVLRIEDTDIERSNPESSQRIIESMQWLGLDYAEGPFYQKQLLKTHNQAIAQLLSTGQAYYCDCTASRLEQLRTTQMQLKQKPRYDQRCLSRQDNIDLTAPYVVRFKNPPTGSVVFDDLVKGKIVVSNAELDDLIIRRSNGMPTYNLSVVVDDINMQISHIIRGDDHISNTPRQINIMQALGAKVPSFAHLPMILGKDGKRLSKRHGANSILEYRQAGFLPEALLNYLARLGWAYGDCEIINAKEIAKIFSFSNINNSAAAFDSDKLLWLNHQYIIHANLPDIMQEINYHCKNLGIDLANGPSFSEVFNLFKSRSHTLVELMQSVEYLYTKNFEVCAQVKQQYLSADKLITLKTLHKQLTNIESWDAENINLAIKNTMQELKLKKPEVAIPLRVSVLGVASSPDVAQSVALLTKNQALARINSAIEYINSSS